LLSSSRSNNYKSTTLADWSQLVEDSKGAVSRGALIAFVEEHFDQPGNELEDFSPPDFNQDQSFDFISDPYYRAWAQELHKKWPTLTRRIKDQVKQEPERYSLIALPNHFIVPGGRFRELYYWDSFWTIRGLLASRMYETVKGMIANMVHMIEVYGFIPNGNRIYYLNRSQPPLLTWCVDAYFNATQDIEFVAQVMPALEKEMEFFMKNKLIHQPGWKSHLFRFQVNATFPRPESYREDWESAEHLEDILEKCRLWGDIAAAAESGRDFSARWFSNSGPQAGKMGSTRTSTIIPVELNAIICSNLRIFSTFYEYLGKYQEAQRARLQYELMREAIHQVFWNEEQGSWFDYDIVSNAQIQVFHDTNLFPLFANVAHDNFNSQRIVEYLTRAGVLQYPGGIPTSLITSGQQWDFPSGWAPTNWITIMGLRMAGQAEIASALAGKWVKKNFIIWRENGQRMFEKYNIASECYRSVGGGGEYEVQEGFGWTNGVILDLLLTFNGELAFDPQAPMEAQCECCRHHPAVHDTVSTPPQDTIVNHLDLPNAAVEAATIAALAAELAQNTPAAAFNDGPALIRAA